MLSRAPLELCIHFIAHQLICVTNLAALAESEFSRAKQALGFAYCADPLQVSLCCGRRILMGVSPAKQSAHQANCWPLPSGDCSGKL